ncbi:MAG: sulfate permease [Alcanivorax sp.]|nr:sulfate permease [Alcanivorax sp.]
MTDNTPPNRFAAWLPDWLRRYQRAAITGDMTAALVATLLLIPQGLAYAALAGLPPHVGLYASLLPLVAYAAFGSSMVLSVGPVAVLALMTASTLTPLFAPGSAEYVAAAGMLALLSGVMLFVFGLLRLGVLAQLLSHPVISGFISGAAVLIIIGQMRPLLGIDVSGASAVTLLMALVANIDDALPLTSMVGLGALALLVLARLFLARALVRLGLPAVRAALAARLAPMVVVLGAIVLVVIQGWQNTLHVVGTLPGGLPSLTLPTSDWSVIQILLLPALAIGLVGFVESVSIGQSMAARYGQRLNPDAELRGLGAANMASAVSGGFPVTGSFARTVVNAEGGARTPMAGLFAAALMALVLLGFTGLFSALPLTVLAATIIVAAAGLIDLNTLRHAWRYDRTDAVALLGTFAGVVLFGVEAGIAIGIGLSLATLVWRASRPHIAVVGRLPGTEHFRNVNRYEVETHSSVLFLRIDENLFFGNVRAVEDRVLSELKRQPEARHLVLIMSSVSRVDGTALDTLHGLNKELAKRNILLHLAEVKGPVLDRLARSSLLEQLSGKVFMSAFEAEVFLAES